MYVMNIANKHRRNYVAYADMVGGELVAVVANNFHQLNRLVKESFGIVCLTVYDAGGEIIADWMEE